MSLAKHNAFTERLSPLLRLDAFSAFHHPLFENLAPAITNPATVGKGHQRRQQSSRLDRRGWKLM
jgi:hypothetical protein